MNVLSAESLSKSYNEKFLFKELSLSLHDGDKIAMIAANGTGKTTLMNIIAGKEFADSGTVVCRRDFTLAYLEQDPQFDTEQTVINTIFSEHTAIADVLAEYEKYLLLNKNDDYLHSLIEKIDALNGWSFEARVREILHRLGIGEFDKQIKFLSGGQRKRLALASLLIKDADILLLDEPTNHLDLDMIEWLESYLKSLNKSMLIISHDRYFIDSVCNAIFELEDGKLFQYKGNYAYYLEKKGERDKIRASEIGKAQNLYTRELDWMRRQPKARGTKQKAREDAFYRVEEKAKQKMPDEKINITMQMNRLGSKILEFEYVSKSYGDKTILQDFAYTFKRGERIGIVGKNGVGKSTLLNMVMNLVKPDRGKIKPGETVVFGYFTQQAMQFEENKRVIDIARDIADYVDLGDGEWMNVSRFLERFQFKGNKQHDFVSKLSGGEKRRLYLLTILLKNPNFLILDEPTNDLDIVTLNTLEDFLMEYQGCLLLVTHDRYFMDKLVDHIFVFEGNGIVKDINGNYTDYREQRELLLKTAETEKKSAEPVHENKPQQKTKLSFNEKREFDLLEKEISELEKKKTQLLTELEKTTDHQQLHAASLEYDHTLKLIEEKTHRWLELAEFVK